MSALSSRIVVVGSLNVDLIARVPHFPAPGETLMGSSFSQGPGGKGANQAAAAAALSVTNAVAMVGSVGDDGFGRDYLAAFAASGVATELISIARGISTGVAPIFVDARGENCIVVVPGANDTVTPSAVDAALARVPHAAVLLCQLEVPLPATLAALRAAAARGIPSFFTPAPAPPGGLADDAFFALTSVLIPNLGEARALVGSSGGAPLDPASAAAALIKRGACAVVVTLGAGGCLVVAPAGGGVTPPRAQLCTTPHGDVFAHAVTATRVANVVDTTGAGDCFSGSLAFFYAHLAEGATAAPLTGSGAAGAAAHVHWASLVEAAQRASYVAACSVTRAGTQSSYTRRADLPAALFAFPADGALVAADIPTSIE